jgi:hypothetical protein
LYCLTGEKGAFEMIEENRELTNFGKALRRRRPTLPPKARPFCSNLIEQIKAYNNGNGDREKLPKAVRWQMSEMQAAIRRASIAVVQPPHVEP